MGTNNPAYLGARREGMPHHLALQYADCLLERDDYLEWLDNLDQVWDWKVLPVAIPMGAKHYIDEFYERTCWEIAPGNFVYDEEPDAIVAMGHPDEFSARFTPVGPHFYL